MNRRTITVRNIPAEIHQKLLDVAHYQQLSMNQVCNNIIKDFLYSHEQAIQQQQTQAVQATTQGRLGQPEAIDTNEGRYNFHGFTGQGSSD